MAVLPLSKEDLAAIEVALRYLGVTINNGTYPAGVAMRELRLRGVTGELREKRFKELAAQVKRRGLFWQE